mmetsp:Transcript_34151/g.108837  ORF Transcript_34151/g.108837 Transcript_34151/m.108837 type:complete len:89 (+) Transcript_34151:276-542(+)
MRFDRAYELQRGYEALAPSPNVGSLGGVRVQQASGNCRSTTLAGAVRVPNVHAIEGLSRLGKQMVRAPESREAAAYDSDARRARRRDS